jgi:hypothetical protein
MSGEYDKNQKSGGGTPARKKMMDGGQNDSL